mgnify:CR=1|jgi:hypothetical protein|tara:strand:+ start:5859 stop:6059 length:201 start_codon:yes stop_codon:yes gene_type:complete
MPDMTKPYSYIETEIERLDYAEQDARQTAANKNFEADVFKRNRIQLKIALDKQKEADEERHSAIGE